MLKPTAKPNCIKKSEIHAQCEKTKTTKECKSINTMQCAVKKTTKPKKCTKSTR
jgi:hypothetical protein